MNLRLSGRFYQPHSLFEFISPSSFHRSPPSNSLSDSSSVPPRPLCDQPRTRTTAGQAFDDVLHLKALRKVEQDKSRFESFASGNGCANGGVGVTRMNGGVSVVACVVVPGDGADDVNVSSNGGAVARRPCSDVAAVDFYLHQGLSDLSPSAKAIACLSLYVEFSSFDIHPDAITLEHMESDILWQHVMSFSPVSPLSVPLRATSHVFPSRSPHFDLSKAPSSYAEAVAHPDAPVWRAAMDCEKQSLHNMGAFEEADLPASERTIGLKWVYDHKTDADGKNISGKEKARLVAQGFNQRPGQFDKTYAPVAKMASIRIFLAWAAARDLNIFQFDCKTAFLHAKIRHPLYARPFPGYPASDPSKVLRILVALYGLQQAAYEFYMLIRSLLLALGMVRCARPVSCHAS